MNRLLLFLCFSVFVLRASAQTNSEQLWTDYVVDYPFRNKYLFETELSYQTLLSQKDKWRSYNAEPSFEMAVSPLFDLISAVPVSYTVQKDNFNTFETRLMLGGRFYFTPGKRIETRSTLRFEHRFFKELNTGDWDITNRFRLTAELIIPINRVNYYQDKMWYALTDAEVFMVTDHNVNERFANLLRIRVGLGYRLSYSLRFEAIYASQTSRDEITTEDTSTSTIFRFRIKHYLNKTKPSKNEDTGN